MRMLFEPGDILTLATSEIGADEFIACEIAKLKAYQSRKGGV